MSQGSRDITLRIIDTYVNLPILPMCMQINVKKIGVFNWNPRQGEPGDMMKYSMFSKLKPLDYPEGVNEDIDYMAEDCVAPVIIVDTQGVVCRTSHELWGILSNIHDGIIIKQGMNGNKIFPKTLFIDHKNFWVCDLLNVVGRDLLQRLSDYREFMLCSPLD